MKHTPGPWRADWDDNGQWYVEPLGVTGSALRGDSGDCIEAANAHLIAAAPELLEALQALRGWLQARTSLDSGEIHSMKRSIEPVIAKATGGAQ